MAEERLLEERLNHQLELQSWQIEEVFQQNETPVRVTGGTVKKRAVQKKNGGKHWIN